jgi:hypothetical protein
MFRLSNWHPLAYYIGSITTCIADTVAVCAFDEFLDLSGSTEPSAAHKLSASDEPRVYRTFCSQVDSRGNGATAKKLRKKHYTVGDKKPG